MFHFKNNLLLYLTIIVLILVKCSICFNVNFHYNYNLKVNDYNTKIRERESQELNEKNVFYNFNGFENVYSIPLVYPVDICVFQTDMEKYATALHSGPNGVRHFVVFKIMNDSYSQLASIPQPTAISLDCHAFNAKGYVTLTLNIIQTVRFANESSTVYEIAGDDIHAIHQFTTPNMLAMYLWTSGENFLMLQTFAKTNKTQQETLCSYFIWTGQRFSNLGKISCANVKNIAAFEVEGENYIALANEENSKDQIGSEIYKFSRDSQQLQLFQSLATKRAIDVQYFRLKTEGNQFQHYLIFVYAYQNNNQTDKDASNLKTKSIIYHYNNGRFEMSHMFPMKGVRKLLAFPHLESNKVILLSVLEEKTFKAFIFAPGEIIESSAPLPAAAFGHGIANIRRFQDDSNSYLIIANRYMMGNKTNVFLPRFKLDKLTNSLREQMVRWAELKSLKLNEIDVKDLNEKIEKKLQILDEYGYKPKTDLESSNINSVVTENFIYPKMKMSTNYWKALFYINQALELLEQQLHRKYQLERSKRNAHHQEHPHEYLEYTYDSLTVNTLIINQELKAKYVNKVIVGNPEFLQVNAKKIIVKGEPTKPVIRKRFSKDPRQINEQDIEIFDIDHLQINGKLNDFTWNELINSTLKRKADVQFIKSALEIRNLECQRLVVTSNDINGQHLGALIPINGGEYVINQDIQFAAPVKAKNVYIHERLNNVHVFKGKFDVLLKRSNETQIIEGPKKLNSVKVMEPITIAGQLLGKHLESLTPNKAIHDPLILQGDFMINGNVAINQELKASDIIDLRAKKSVKQTLDNGIRMDQPVMDVNIKFLSPLKANSSRVSFVNQSDMQRLVQLNLDEIQIVEGVKIFENSVEIQNGFSEVKNLNGVDVEKLEQNSFLKHTNQTIKVPMKFGKIQAKSIASPSILLNSRNITDFLTKTGNQTIQGNLVVNNLKTSTLLVEHLNTNNRIFQQNLFDIYQQKSRNAPNENVFLENTKFHGSIYVQNLIVNSTINQRNVEEIENNLLKLEGNIKYVGNFKFNYPLNIKGLKFHGMLNDIKAVDFGKCWLQKRGQAQQNFLGPQTIARVKAVKGVHCQGQMNGFTADELFSKTYWINRDEHLKNIVFENPIEMSGGLKTASLNSQFVADDLMRYSNSAQFLEPLVIEGDLEIMGGHISNVSIVNHINLHALDDFLYGSNLDTLYVENVYFAQGPPMYKTLNGRNISQTLDSVWLANENIVLPANVVMKDAHFEGLLLFEGPINNRNLEYLANKYLSKSKSQDISVEMVFDEGITCENTVEASDVELFGPLIELKSGISFDFMSFVHNTLKTSGSHNITGNWSILEAILDGDLKQVLVNELNLVSDVVHNTKTAQPFDIKTTKVFESASIENLLALPVARLNNVPCTNWINDAVYVYENYTIHGTTTIESLNVYNDLRAVGKLNNIIFNENTLLLKDRDQTLPGNLRVISHLVNEHRFLTNNIENLYADFINSEYMPAFMTNRMPLTKNPKIQSPVVFKKPLKVENFQGSAKSMLTPRNAPPWIKRSLRQKLPSDLDAMDKSQDQELESVEQVENYFSNITTAPYYALDHFEIRQSLKVNASQITAFGLNTSTGLIEVLAVVENPTKNTIFYKWSTERKMFEKYDDFKWPAMNPASLNVVQKLYGLIQQPLDIEYIREVFNNIHDIVLRHEDPVSQVEFLSETCFISYTTTQLQKQNEFRINCLDLKKHEISKEVHGKTTSNILQLLPLNSTSFALLNNNSLEMWNFSIDKVQLFQKMSLIAPKHMAIQVFKGIQYLAVLTEPSTKSLSKGTLEIFRSIKCCDFHHWQSLTISNPINVEFAYVAETDDLLLHVLTHVKEKPLIIYQYQGVMGFQEIVNVSNLPIKGLQLKSLETITKASPHHMLAIVEEEQISLLEIVLRKL